MKRTTDTSLFISHTTNVLMFKFRCIIFIGVRIIKEIAGSVASGTHCIIWDYFHNNLIFNIISHMNIIQIYLLQRKTIEAYVVNAQLSFFNLSRKYIRAVTKGITNVTFRKAIWKNIIERNV